MCSYFPKHLDLHAPLLLEDFTFLIPSEYFKDGFDALGNWKMFAQLKNNDMSRRSVSLSQLEIYFGIQL